MNQSNIIISEMLMKNEIFAIKENQAQQLLVAAKSPIRKMCLSQAMCRLK